MWSIVRRIYWIVAVILISGCSGGGCSGCGGGALTPIPGGYPLTPETRIPRAAQVRLTESGLAQVQAVAPSLLGGFVGSGINVPRTSQDLGVGKAVICPSGTCTINITLPSDALRLSFAEPNAINANVRVIVSGDIPLTACLGRCDDNCRGTFCARIANPTLRIDTHGGSHPYIGLRTRATIRRDTHPPRQNYHRADIVSQSGGASAIEETPGEGIENADLTCSESWICGILNLLEGTIIGQFRGQLASALGPVTDALAQRSEPNPPGCPTGTTTRDGKCYYSDNTAVPTLLGTDARGNMGRLLASVAPGAQANVSYLLAAGDNRSDGQVINGGMTIDVFGAFQSMGHNACVPRVAAPRVPEIPEFMALRANTVPGTSTPIDFGLGLSEDFLNYAAFQMWDAGMLCLGLGTSTSQQLNAGTFSVLPALSSLRAVLFPNTTGPIAIVLRPQQPPNVRLGRGSNIDTDPTLKLNLPSLALDFYAWSEERYVRFMTMTTDANVGINLVVDTGGLRPQLGTLHTENVRVTNTQLLSGNPALIGASLQALLGPAISMVAGSLPTIAIPSIPVPGSMGSTLGNITINIPPAGVQGVTEGSARFLGIFAGLRFMPARSMPLSLTLDTTASLDGVQINPALYHSLEGLRSENLPTVRFTVSTPNDFGRGVEYAYKIDRGTWSAWSTETQYAVQDPAFLFPGRHTVAVRARTQGEPETADTDPAVFDVIVDGAPPTVVARLENGRVIVEATDESSTPGELQYSFQFGDSPASEWGAEPSAAVPEGVTHIKVRVRDAHGNITEEVITRQSLIRGGPTTDSGGSGCGCRVGGNTSRSGNSALGLLALIGLGAALTRRRRARNRAAAMVALGLGVVATGCASTDNSTTGTDSGTVTPGDSGTMTTTDSGSACPEGQNVCASSGMCVAPPACPDCMPGFAASGAPTFNASACTYDTASCSCMPLPPLSKGAVGSHLHSAAGSDSAIWLSAYSPGDPTENSRYGDLVVGRWNTSTMQADWVHVDGVPADGMVTGDTSGWRGGVSTPGDDVGRFNSIAVGAMNRPRVAYWDATHDKLKFASFDGTTWTSHTVDPNGSNGRYTSLVLLADGTPVIAYRAVDVGADGAVRAIVRVARANSPSPARSADWTIADVGPLASACRASDCPMGQACVESTGRCAATTAGCSPACSATQACIASRCQDVFAPTYIEAIPPGALYINLIADSMGRLALVWYHRDRGNLMLSQGNAMGSFGAPTILDGETSAHADTGDRGIYSTTTYGPDGALHIAYVDGWAERLMYLRVVSGAPMGAPIEVDDGAGLGTTPFDDGKHIIGDSASINVAADGTVRIAYQDTTVGTLRLATLAPRAMAFTRTVIDMNNHTGYWASIAGGQVATFWRDLSDAAMRRFGVRVSPLR